LLLFDQLSHYMPYQELPVLTPKSSKKKEKAKLLIK
jgi:hypothetical protein